MYPVLFPIDVCVVCSAIPGSFLVADNIARILFDTGSSFSFISESFAAEIGIKPTRLAFYLDVVTPLGEHNLVWKFFRSIGVKLREMDFEASLIVMDIREYDVILGMY